MDLETHHSNLNWQSQQQDKVMHEVTTISANLENSLSICEKSLAPAISTCSITGNTEASSATSSKDEKMCVLDNMGAAKTHDNSSSIELPTKIIKQSAIDTNFNNVVSTRENSAAEDDLYPVSQFDKCIQSTVTTENNRTISAHKIFSEVKDKVSLPITDKQVKHQSTTTIHLDEKAKCIVENSNAGDHEISLVDSNEQLEQHSIVSLKSNQEAVHTSEHNPSNTFPKFSQSNSTQLFKPTQSSDKVSFSKNLQTIPKESLIKSSTNSSKVKIQPILGHAVLAQMMKAHGPFPVVYIGAPNKTDYHQPSLTDQQKQTNDVAIDLTKELPCQRTDKTLRNAKKIEIDLMKEFPSQNPEKTLLNRKELANDLTKELPSQSTKKTLPNEKEDAVAANNIHNPSRVVLADKSAVVKTVSGASCIPISSSVATVSTLTTTNNSYDLKKAMDGFLDESAVDVGTKPLYLSLLRNADPAPSLVMSGHKACEKSLFPVVQNHFNYRVTVPLTHQNSSLKPSVPSKQVPQHLQPYFSKSTGFNATNLDINKVRFHAAAGPNGVSKPLPTLAPSFKPVLFSDALKKKKAYPVVTCSGTFQSGNTSNLLKRKAESSSSEPMIKIWKPELTSQTDSTESMDNQASKKTPSSDGSCLSQNKMMTPKFLKKTGKPGWYNQLGNTMQKKVIPDSTCKIGTANPRWKTFPKLFKSVKRKAPKDTEPVSLLPPPDTMTRPGVLVQFEDNVQLWIVKLRDLMYLDDEPVLSFKLEKGTEVAARYTDGLFYDAIVLATHDGPSVRASKKNTSRLRDTASSASKSRSPKTGVCNNVQKKTSSHATDKSSTTVALHGEAFSSDSANKTPPQKTVGQRRSADMKMNEPSAGLVISSKHSPSVSLPRVRIKKLDFRDGEAQTWNAKLIENEPVDVGSSSKSAPTEKVSLQVKCPNCFLVFRSIMLFRQHQKTVCGCKGITIAGCRSSDPDALVVVDESDDDPPLVRNFSRNGVPRDRDGKRCFRRGTHILHRWQTSEGRKWYNGKILRIFESKKGTKSDFEIDYLDDDHDGGPLCICLYDDYPHDVRVVTR